MDKITLDNLKFMLNRRVSERFINNVNVDVVADRITSDIYLYYQLNILGQKNTKEYRFDYSVPLNWFQHLKQDVFPKFILKIFPVKYVKKTKTLEFNHFALFPELQNTHLSDKIVFYNERYEG